MADAWFYTSGGASQGPITWAQLQQLAASGGVSPADMVWTEGMANWLPGSQIPQLFGAAPAPQQYAQTPYNAPQGAAPVNYGGYGAPMGQPVGQSHKGMAIAGLVLACVGLCCFGIITAPIGMILGFVAKNNMKRDGNLEGEGIATAAIIAGSIITVLNIIGLIIYFTVGFGGLHRGF